MYDYKEHADFCKYYDNGQKRNYWLLGYFGGGAVCISDAFEIAKDYAKEYNVALDSVKIDEILSSRRYKGYKFIFSTTVQEQDEQAIFYDDVHKILRD